MRERARFRVRLASKADTLAALRGTLRRSAVPPLSVHTAADWHRDRAGVLATLARELPPGPVAVRSSARDEDRPGASAAGRYRSRLGVARDDRSLARAIDDVLAAMPGDGGDQVLVQAMVQDVSRAGVVLTRDPETGAPYLVVELDERGTRTDAITSGRHRGVALAVHHAAPAALVGPAWLAGIVDAAREVAGRFGGAPLDLEVAQDDRDRTFLLQARRLHTPALARPHAADRGSRARLERLAAVLRERSRRRPGLAGSRTILGQMPDWNPAELIGARPAPLVVSLFRSLISDSVYAQARRWLGYRATSGEPLVLPLASRPYVDVRVSLNSLLPAGLPPQLEESAIDAMLDRLAAHPELHDALEFEVAATALDFATRRALAARYGSRLGTAARRRLEESLLELTRRLLAGAPGGSLHRALRAIDARERLLPTGRRESIAHGAGDRFGLAACRGDAFWFAVVARHAFVAEALLRSATSRGALAPERVEAFRASIATVAGALARDLRAAAAGALPREAFLERHGHLRPGMFDVTSQRYDRRHDLLDTIAGAPARDVPPASRAPFALTAAERRSIDRLIADCGLALAADDLLRHAARAIAGRERAKLALARRLSDALEALAAWALDLGLEREDLAFLTLDDVRGLGASGATRRADRGARRPETGDALRERARCRRDAALADHRVRLGPLVRDERDLWVVTDPPSRPSFVGTGSAAGAPVVVDARSRAVPLAGRIACIESADPGFDWIFAAGVGGLVTRFGGGNSHMAIRCWELGVPAALGVGEPAFARLARSPIVELRCPERIVREICDASA